MKELTIYGMADKIIKEKDMVDVGTWMIESIPGVFTELMGAVLGDKDEYTDEEYERFCKALWTALYRVNVEMED